jgi:hypothetical protein
MSVWDDGPDRPVADDDEVPPGIPRHAGNDRPRIRRKDDPRKFVNPYPHRPSALGKPLQNSFLLNRRDQELITWAMARHEHLQLRARAVGAIGQASDPRAELARSKDAEVAKLAKQAINADREEIRQVAKLAHQLAEGDAAATKGSALHRVWHRQNLGETILAAEVGAKMYTALLALNELLKGWKVHAAELFVVWDCVTCSEQLGRPVTHTGGSLDVVLSPLGIYRFEDPLTHEQVELTPDDRIVGDLKGLALDTPIPTPSGWTTMGAIQVGDQVFGSDGQPCTVTAKSQTKRIGTYVVEFDRGGERIVCDREHLWWVMTGRQVTPGHKPSLQMHEQVIDVETLRDTLFRYGQRQHRVPVSEPLDLPAVDLPIDPYLLGCWLGDGKTSGSEITKGEDLFDILRADGHKLGLPQAKPSTEVVSRTVLGLAPKLRAAGLYGHKMIPDAYLRASIEQRMALLRGLMDTDGTWNIARDRAVFVTTDKALAAQVSELVVSLGLKPQRGEWDAKGYGLTVRAYGVEFRPAGFNPFRLPRKAEQVIYGTGARARYRIVQSVEPGPDIETACIAVSSPNNTYLCGQDMIPTHNSGAWDVVGIVYGCQMPPYALGTPYEHVTDAAAKDGDNGRRPWPDGIEPRRDWVMLPHVPLESPEDARISWVNVDRAQVQAHLAIAAAAADGCAGELFAPGEFDMLDAVRTRDGWRVVAELDEDALTATLYTKNEYAETDGPGPFVLREAMTSARLAELVRGINDEAEFWALWDQHAPIWTGEVQRAARARGLELGWKVDQTEEAR